MHKYPLNSLESTRLPLRLTPFVFLVYLQLVTTSYPFQSYDEIFFYLLPLHMGILLHSLLSLHPPKLKPLNLNKPKSLSPLEPSASLKVPTFRRDVVLRTSSLCFVSFILQNPLLESLADPSKSPPKPARLAIANTNSWFQYFGDGFSIRVPPQFIDFTEPEVCVSLSLSIL